ncbi:hypothetical protein [Comamonas sp. 26]|uniref:hypothetical protein n=1 Tax=Comamonas sp. 26 TaxID=2035201 RepID=UPI00130467BC|nr:hypothetical protein [Comamonas sp. 26]
MTQVSRFFSCLEFWAFFVFALQPDDRLVNVVKQTLMAGAREALHASWKHKRYRGFLKKISLKPSIYKRMQLSK